MAKARAESRRYVKVTEVYVSEVFNKSGPTARCCAPGCGDKIKPLNSSDSCYEIMWLDGDVTYLESGCLDWFVNGHPDYSNGFGKIAPPLNCAVCLRKPAPEHRHFFCNGPHKSTPICMMVRRPTVEA